MSKNAFIDYLCGLAAREDRGALAHLRRGLGKPPGTVPQMYPYVAPWLPRERSRQEDVCYLVAALFASHPEHSDAMGSMGDTMRGTGQASGNMDSVERRFVTLLNAHADELPDHLRHAVALAKSRGISVNYGDLLMHLQHWDHPERWVQRRWASDFWGEEKEEQPAEAAAVKEGD